MPILVTGGAGYIGSHTCLKLMEAGHEVVLLDNFCNSHRGVLEGLWAIAGKAVELVEGDVRDAALLSKVFASHDISAVIHFAALKAVGDSVQRPLDYYDNNLNGSLALLKAMREAGTKTLVFSSSATVYGNPVHVPVREDAPLAPTNPYGHSKRMVETVLETLYQADATWRVARLRYFNPVGAHESGLIGENPQGVPGNLMPYVARVAAGKLPKLQVFGGDYSTRDGTGVRDYVHVMDLAEGHVGALEYLRMRGGLLTLNLGGGRGHSVLELVHTFEEACGCRVPFEVVPRRPGDVAECWADTGAALQTLGWKPQRDLATMCMDAWRWQQQTGFNLT
jgi:UDP-glucose 4-epimerase